MKIKVKCSNEPNIELFTERLMILTERIKVLEKLKEKNKDKK